jgi:hypothetical protein
LTPDKDGGAPIDGSVPSSDSGTLPSGLGLSAQNSAVLRPLPQNSFEDGQAVPLSELPGLDGLTLLTQEEAQQPDALAVLLGEFGGKTSERLERRELDSWMAQQGQDTRGASAEQGSGSGAAL